MQTVQVLDFYTNRNSEENISEHRSVSERSLQLKFVIVIRTVEMEREVRTLDWITLL